ncbi:unnamed protein product, partial [Allacma fusca]
MAPLMRTRVSKCDEKLKLRLRLNHQWLQGSGRP